VDAAACFLATALGSLSPQALGLFDFAPTALTVGRPDAQEGKFTDRVLVGGLAPLSWEESRPVPPVPAFLHASWPGPEVAGEPPRQIAAAARPVAREPAPRRIEKPSEPVPQPAVAEPSRAPETRPESEPGMLAALTPSGLSAKLATAGQKAWGGARSLGGAAISGGLSWLGY
jgi:hypothetical protein